ncbi:MAG: tetratricopeptide repeat protein [Rhodobacteraceae bacterium]|nr:tetratricopeptide repeat protein [Paracoccaceae bacterium]
MGILKTFLKPTVAATFGAMTFLQPSLVRAADVETLLQQLRDADATEAAKIEREIELEWSKSGSASADFLLKRGRQALERGEVEAAIEHLSALVDHAPGFAEGWVNRAAAYFEAGLYGPAVSDLEQALALNPDHYGALLGLAAIFEMLEQHEDAWEAYTLVRAIHPTHPKVTEALDRLEPLVKGQAL